MSSTPHRKSRHRRRHHHRSSRPFLKNGLAALVGGFCALFVSMGLSIHPLFSVVGRVIRFPAWLAIGVGVLLLGLHYVLRDKAAEDARRSRSREVAPSPAAAAVPVRRIGEPANAIWATDTLAPPDVSSSTPPETTYPTTPTRWGAAVFNAIEWRRFEAVCEALFMQAGFATRTQSHGADGGVDVWLHSRHAQGPVSVVQCKHWSSRQVGVKEVREFFGVMASHQLKRGTYATTSTFSADAVAFAKRNGIHLLDGTGLLKLIATRTPEQQQALLDVAFEGDYARPTCASCGIKMVERTKRKTGTPFWGCSNYPRCHSQFARARQAA